MSVLGNIRRLVLAPFRPDLVIPAHRLQIQGAEGEDIAAFQRVLLRRCAWFEIVPPIAITGVYDEQTRNAVRLYQHRALSIRDADGFVGPVTARRLHIRITGESGR